MVMNSQLMTSLSGFKENNGWCCLAEARTNMKNTAETACHSYNSCKMFARLGVSFWELYLLKECWGGEGWADTLLPPPRGLASVCNNYYNRHDHTSNYRDTAKLRLHTSVSGILHGLWQTKTRKTWRNKQKVDGITFNKYFYFNCFYPIARVLWRNIRE